MTNSNYGSSDLIAKALRAGAEAILAVLNGTEGGAAKTVAGVAPDNGGPIEYDPLHDDPPFTPVPNGGTEAEGWMTSVTYLGAIARINAEENRGATREEIPVLAKRAGYVDGRVVNGWNSRPTSVRSIENKDGARFLNQAGLDYVKKCADKLGITLVGEMSAVPTPEA
ncbi:hypothetical protein BJ980_000037 [Nocardioides daedukensis]|uniref:Uncharacterized protein n=1 Tax=Nocardioides daedukensis TaxID=634462 RepID=A0A7Y9RZR7_9ACTN|nr:hypothetical protein [Nocardioides daedukensis]NYG57114.1 hypothetical protein [Nocardioides daedukensis]